MPAVRAFQADLVERTLLAGWALRYTATVGSTQDVARAAAHDDADDRTIFLADYQTAGRGRHGRHWFGAPGSGLTLSILFRAPDSPATPRRYTTAVSLALSDAIGELVPAPEPRLKWPNDVMLGERKVAGVLTEADSAGVIVGVGVNVNADAHELEQAARSATSIRLAAGRRVSREELLIAFIRRLEDWLQEPAADAYAAWERRLWGMGQRLRYADGDVDDEVVVLGVDVQGRLRLRLADGSERLALTGELIL
jgi:BirA family biotin operon repressor/biotin-[acetyl-CoA-carboxylase] ligase